MTPRETAPAPRRARFSARLGRSAARKTVFFCNNNADFFIFTIVNFFRLCYDANVKYLSICTIINNGRSEEA